MTEKSRKRAVLLKNIDRSLMDQFKAECARRGFMMNDVFITLIEDYIRSPHSYRVLRKQERSEVKKRDSIYGG